MEIRCRVFVHSCPIHLQTTRTVETPLGKILLWLIRFNINRKDVLASQSLGSSVEKRLMETEFFAKCT